MGARSFDVRLAAQSMRRKLAYRYRQSLHPKSSHSPEPNPANVSSRPLCTSKPDSDPDVIAAMKRKLDKNDEPPSPAQSDEKVDQREVQQPEKDQRQQPTGPKAEPSFAELGLDPRLIQAVAKQGFEKPTLVQRTAIPLTLQGQDVLCKAKTGSGKTAAYVLPLLSGILKRKSVCYCPVWEVRGHRVNNAFYRRTRPPSPPLSYSFRPASSPIKSTGLLSSFRHSAQRISTRRS